MSVSRREFLTGCSAGIAAMAGGRVGNMVFAEDQSASGHASTLAGTDHVFVMVFLRGGMDGLSYVVPVGDQIYYERRAPQGANTWNSLAVQNTLDLNINNGGFGVSSGFGLHPQALGLHRLYQSGHAAFVHATGLNNDTRSHFDAMDFIERGALENKNAATGWLARHLQVVAPQSTLPTVAAGNAIPSSLLGSPLASSIASSNDYQIQGPWRYTDDDPTKNQMYTALKRMYTGDDTLNRGAKRLFQTVDAMSNALPALRTTWTSAMNPLTNLGGSFVDSLKLISQIIQAGELNLRVATVDLGGWDHHENQGVNGGQFFNLIGTLSDGLAAFYNEITAAGMQNRVTIAVMSEFGRRLGANLTLGTDHGHGGVMTVLGGKVNGGKLYGVWPGLADLDQSQDLRITTDYRAVLGEIVVNLLGNDKLGTVFPGLTEGEYLAQVRGLVSNPAAQPAIDYVPAALGTTSMYLPIARR